MLVDDSELDNFINEKMIESAHFARHVYINTSSKSALEFLTNLEETGVSEDIYPQLIFIDLNMPTIDGFQFINYLQEMKSEKIDKCKLVILTSSIHPGDKKRANQLSSKIVFLNKPLNDAMLNDL